MAGVYGNDNLAFMPNSQFVTVDGSADLSDTLPTDTYAVTLYSTTDVWWNFTERGKDTPAAAAPAAEKTYGDSKFLPAGIMLDVAVPESHDAALIKVAYIQASAGGTLYITPRNDTN
jgi:hypothetical protein